MRKTTKGKFVIVNPECIPIAQERLMKFLYEGYKRETDLKKVKKLEESK